MSLAKLLIFLPPQPEVTGKKQTFGYIVPIYVGCVLAQSGCSRPRQTFFLINERGQTSARHSSVAALASVRSLHFFFGLFDSWHLTFFFSACVWIIALYTFLYVLEAVYFVLFPVSWTFCRHLPEFPLWVLLFLRLLLLLLSSLFFFFEAAVCISGVSSGIADVGHFTAGSTESDAAAAQLSIYSFYI